jgi:hypothetical protein
MYFKSKKISLSILAITAVVCSRTMLLCIDDPEGPNLLIVLVLGAFVYIVSLVSYLFNCSVLRKFVCAIFVQVTVVTILYILNELGF